jgi:hypothetical protein
MGLDVLALPVMVRALIDSLSTPDEPEAQSAPMAVVVTPEAPTPSTPVAFLRQPQAKTPRQANSNPELESAADHCSRWLGHCFDELQGLKSRARIQRYLTALAEVDDQVFRVNGWNAVVARAFGVTREAVRQAKNAWMAEQAETLFWREL